MQNWTRAEYFDDTGLPWTNPSPNLRDPQPPPSSTPALGLIELPTSPSAAAPTPPSNTSAPPGHQRPQDVAAYLTARHIPGVTFAPTTFAVAEDTNHYPFHGQTIPGRPPSLLTDRTALDSPELGIELLAALHQLLPHAVPARQSRHPHRQRRTPCKPSPTTRTPAKSPPSWLARL
jgi:uncharacterized protein YbbC (DUF1343 family)